MLIDTHTHLYLPDFDADRAEVLCRAREAGVTRMVLPNINRESVAPLWEFRREQGADYAVLMGLHPTEIQENYPQDLAFLWEQLQSPACAGVGEIGLDKHWDIRCIDVQKIVFEAQIDWAVQKNMPMSIHSREAFADTVDCLRKFDKHHLRGVFHAFSLGAQQAEQLLSLGDFYLGINGVCTYKNARFIAQLPAVPLQRIVVETDAPYLTPVPFRGCRNEPAYLPYVLAKLSEVYGVSLFEVERITTQNAEKLYFSSPV